MKKWRNFSELPQPLPAAANKTAPTPESQQQLSDTQIQTVVAHLHKLAASPDQAANLRSMLDEARKTLGLEVGYH